MIYAEFQHLSTGHGGKPKEPIPALGSDGVFIVDGRKSLSNQIRDAREHAKKLIHVRSDIIGLRMMRGRSFSNSFPISKVILFDDYDKRMAQH